MTEILHWAMRQGPNRTSPLRTCVDPTLHDPRRSAPETNVVESIHCPFHHARYLVGIITKNPNRPTVEAELSTMIDSMLHEPFYRSGALTVPELGCHLGWVCQRDSMRTAVRRRRNR